MCGLRSAIKPVTAATIATPIDSPPHQRVTGEPTRRRGIASLPSGTLTHRVAVDDPSIGAARGGLARQARTPLTAAPIGGSRAAVCGPGFSATTRRRCQCGDPTSNAFAGPSEARPDRRRSLDLLNPACQRSRLSHQWPPVIAKTSPSRRKHEPANTRNPAPNQRVSVSTGNSWLAAPSSLLHGNSLRTRRV
jgi:hypothetical protein